MKKIVVWIGVVSLCLFPLGTAAFAQQQGQKTQASQQQGEESIQVTITKVDKKQGMVMLETKQGTQLEVSVADVESEGGKQFLQNLEEGKTLTVQVGASEAMKTAGGAQQQPGQQQQKEQKAQATQQQQGQTAQRTQQPGQMSQQTQATPPGTSAQRAQQPGQTGQQTQATPPGTSAQQSGQLAQQTEGILLSSESVIGSKVKNQEGEDIGEIDRVLIDSATGQVAYAVLGVGGFLGLGERKVIVPWTALRSSQEDGELVMNATKELLQEAPQFEKDKGYYRDREIYSYYGTAPYWEREERGEQRAELREDEWGPDTEYGKLYDPSKMETIQGEIEEVDTFNPLSAESAGVKLNVKTEAGETVEVHLGPESYVDRQNLELKEGDQVTIEGARANMDGEPVIIAATVQKDGKTLRLRDEDGFPRWSKAQWRD